MSNASEVRDFALGEAERRIAAEIRVPSEYVTLERSTNAANHTVLKYTPFEDGPRLTPVQLQTVLDDLSRVGIGYVKTSHVPADKNAIPEIVLKVSPEKILETLSVRGMVKAQG